MVLGKKKERPDSATVDPNAATIPEAPTKDPQETPAPGIEPEQPAAAPAEQPTETTPEEEPSVNEEEKLDRLGLALMGHEQRLSNAEQRLLNLEAYSFRSS